MFGSKSKRQRLKEDTEAELSRLGLNNIPGGAEARLVHLNAEDDVSAQQQQGKRRKQPKSRFAGNTVKTAKYNAVSFLPLYLYQQFSQVAYFYFLIQACLVWWSVVSPFRPYGPVLALVFVLLVGAATALAEDRRRKIDDNRLNNSTAHVVNPDGTERDIKWHAVEVGMVLKVYDNEDFPSDLLCLYCSLPENVCFIKTTNLDGESNLKIRRPLDAKEAAPETPEAVQQLRGTLACEPPNPNLHYFVGKFVLQGVQGEASRDGPAGATVPVTINEMLLRGCTLKNSGFVLGLVVYTGPESRIQMNSAKPPRKQGSYNRFLNVQITVLITLQLLLCVVCAIVSYFWRKDYGNKRYYLGTTTYVQGQYHNAGVYILVEFLTFWLLYSYMVPISLFVTMEIVKFILGTWFIWADKEMTDAGTGEHAKCRNSNIIEDLGRVRYVFSDKTGTLTSNEMRMRQIAIKGIPYGRSQFKLEEAPADKAEAVLNAFDDRLAKATKVLHTAGFWGDTIKSGGSSPQLMKLARANSDATPESVGLPPTPSPGGGSVSMRQVVLGHHVVDFWTNLCICHNLIVEPDDEGRLRYQGPSPDEVALVEGAAQLGFGFVSRTRRDVTISFQGKQVSHALLNTLEFTSDRARMSTIARAPDGTIRLYTKGSDAKMLPLLRRDTDAALMEATAQNLHDFSVKGLRTLVLGSRVLDEAEYKAWDAKYQQAAASLDDREVNIAAVAADIETDLELLGVTAIEDKLQDGVPEAIRTLIDGGMKVWMITGDKQETAVNIGVSCGLITSQAKVLFCNAKGSGQEAAAKLQELEHITEGPPAGPRELVVDGVTLGYILEANLSAQLAQVASRCSSVIVCRASPSQKAAIVRMMMEYELRTAELDGSGGRLGRWSRRYKRRMENKMLSIGDGANDVAMIQAADIGVGIMGKEGRQAVNNSDYAIAQFRFLVRLLMVHGSLSVYRLSRLIKYSFYKNIAFAMVLFFYQFFCGFSGQTLLDGYTSAFYNAIFTALDIGAFAALDRPFRSLNSFIRFPQLYNRHPSLTAASFWKTGIGMGVWHGAAVFFLTYFSQSNSGRNSINDLYSIGKIAFVALVGVVDLEIALITRYWTWIYFIIWVIMFVLVFPFIILLPIVEKWFGQYDPASQGVGTQVLANGSFWLALLAIFFFTFASRFVERGYRAVFHPNDDEIISEHDKKHKDKNQVNPVGLQRLSVLAATPTRKYANNTAFATNGDNGKPGLMAEFDRVSGTDSVRTTSQGPNGALMMGIHRSDEISFTASEEGPSFSQGDSVPKRRYNGDIQMV